MEQQSVVVLIPILAFESGLRITSGGALVWRFGMYYTILLVAR